jgi:hypothetical protein
MEERKGIVPSGDYPYKFSSCAEFVSGMSIHRLLLFSRRTKNKLS